MYYIIFITVIINVEINVKLKLTGDIETGTV